WLFSPELPPKERLKPECIKNIPKIKRKEPSIYKASDMWTQDDDLCMSRDTSCSPSELLKLHVKDIVFDPKGRQYASVTVNGKTGSRSVPLYHSIPLVKQWITEKGGSDDDILLSSRRGKIMNIRSLGYIYNNYRRRYFPDLLNKNIAEEDKDKIRELLKKPFNPYLRRHSALTEKSGILKEYQLRQHAGWASKSQMPSRYIHLFGDESSKSLLESYGAIEKDKQRSDLLKPTECVRCHERNTPNAKFYANPKCRIMLSNEGYVENIESQTKSDKEFQRLKEEYDLVKNKMSRMEDAQNKILS
ncbi:MAG: hypothetical protein WAM14_21240, partial [Candidatus Nitrosopolaris sp.]